MAEITTAASAQAGTTTPTDETRAALRELLVAVVDLIESDHPTIEQCHRLDAAVLDARVLTGEVLS